MLPALIQRQVSPWGQELRPTVPPSPHPTTGNEISLSSSGNFVSDWDSPLDVEPHKSHAVQEPCLH